MIDAKARLEKLVTDAAECEMIARLTTIPAKREAFMQLAENYKTMAEDLTKLIASGNLPRDLGM